MHLFKVYLMKLINCLLGRQRLLESQPNHLPGKVAADTVHVQPHVGVEVEIIEIRCLRRRIVELPWVEIAICSDAHGGVRHLIRRPPG